jgi:hypothetical protein
MMQLPKDCVELLALFNEKKVKALIVGGYAFVYHARPRTTKDVDIWVEPVPDNVQRLLEALDEFGFGSVGLKPEDFLAPGRFVQLGYPPHRIDLMTSLKGVDFEDAWESRVEDDLGEVKVSILGIAELIRNKKAVGRPQDQADVAVLESYENGKS